MQKTEKNIPRAIFISRERLGERQKEFRGAWMRAAQKKGMEHFIIDQIDGSAIGRNVVARGLKELLNGKSYTGLYRSFLEEIGAGSLWLEDAGVPEAFLAEKNPDPAYISYAGGGAAEKWRYDQVVPAGLIDILLLAEDFRVAAEFTRTVVGNPHDYKDESDFWSVMKCLLELTPGYPDIASGIITASRGENGSSRLLVEFIPVSKTLEILEKMRKDVDNERMKFDSDEIAILAVGYLRSRVNKEIREREGSLLRNGGPAPAEASEEQRAIIELDDLAKEAAPPMQDGGGCDAARGKGRD